MEPRIENLPEKELVGLRLRMSLTNDKTHELWQKFMKFRESIPNRTDKKYYSIQVFELGQNISSLTPDTPFEKWAAVEVSESGNNPPIMSEFILSGGKYAVFTHKGLPSDYPKTLKFILEEWLPSSGYKIDSREQFEILEESYDPTDPEAEEEIWIPIK